jgi:hypothetical protein
MPYRPDFYIVDNIVGCTGDIKWPDMATVYFESATEFGHITQQYPKDRRNEGRTKVRQKSLTSEQDQYRYERANEEIEFEERDGTITSEYAFFERLQSISGATDIYPWSHASRSVLVTALTPEDRDILAESITNFPEMKLISRR